MVQGTSSDAGKSLLVTGFSSERLEAAREAWTGRTAAREAAYDRLAEVLREHLDMAAINALVDEGVGS